MLALSMQHQLVQADCQHGLQQQQCVTLQLSTELLSGDCKAGGLKALLCSLLLLQ
jgi:hypothetical protein